MLQRKTAKTNVKILTLTVSMLASFCSNSVANVTALPNAVDSVSTPSVSGVLRIYSEKNPDVFQENWILLSEYGMRVSDDNSRLEIIKNFSEQRVWLQNKTTKLHHEVDVTNFSAEFPELAHYLTGRETQSNVLGARPCADFTAELKGERVWRGIVVEEWKCTLANGILVNNQYFVKDLSMVVRVLHPSSMVEEFRNITQRETLSGDFLPDEKFKSVEYLEFSNGENSLEKYQD